MFKKLLLAATLLLGISGYAAARDTYAHSADVLPQPAKITLNKNFKAPVSVVKIDKQLGRISEYEVVLTDGSEISFDRDGNWESVEVSNKSAVPAGFIPRGVSDFVSKNQPNTKIVGVEVDHNVYEITLNNGVDMLFDKHGHFLKYD